MLFRGGGDVPVQKALTRPDVGCIKLWTLQTAPAGYTGVYNYSGRTEICFLELIQAHCKCTYVHSAVREEWRIVKQTVLPVCKNPETSVIARWLLIRPLPGLSGQFGISIIRGPPTPDHLNSDLYL